MFSASINLHYECVMDLLPQIIEVLFEDNEPNDKK